MNKYEKLIELVAAEAQNIREHATPAEISKLNFKDFNPRLSTSCVYGQMTGNCYNLRANQLITKCATKVYKVNEHSAGLNANNIDNLNGKPRKVTYRSAWYHSPIELYVYLNRVSNSEEFNENLLDYIKGKTDTIEINPLMVCEEIDTY